MAQTAVERGTDCFQYASQDYLDAACETVCPLQPACGHLQLMSGVFSIASHSVLQYFPEVTLQEQTGWAHFLLSAIGSPFRRT